MKKPDLVLSTTDIRCAIAIAIEANVPMLLWGNPGEGKSRTVEAVAAALGRDAETVIGSIREAADFAGLPERSPSGVVLHAPRWAHRAAAAGRAVVFLDELTTATPPVQAAMLRVVLDREVGDLRLPDTVSVIAAANPPELAADGYDLAAPLANRFCHLWFEADVADWAEGLVAGWPAWQAPAMPAPSVAELAAWRARVAAYIRMRPMKLRAEADEMAAGVAFPSPRAWDTVARLAAFAHAASAPEDVLWSLVAGCVGAGAAHELMANVHMVELPDPEALLDGSTRLEPWWSPGQALAVVGSIVSSVRIRPTHERWCAAIALMDAVADVFGEDIAAFGTAPLLELRAPAWPLPPEISRFGRLLTAAGE